MIDGHIHIERGPYTLDWINQFVNRAVEMQMDEIRLLEHCYRFEEFVPMYDSVCAYSEYANTVAKALKKIPSLDSNIVPDSSLIREFIPGGMYEDLY